MFVLSHHISNWWGRKTEEYEKEIKQRARNSSYYTEQELRERYRSPKQKLIKTLREVGIWSGVALFTFAFIAYIVAHVEVEVQDTSQQTSQEEKK